MTRNSIFASMLYRMAVEQKNQDFSKLKRNRNRNNLIFTLSAMQFLTNSVGMKHISPSTAEIIISTLRNTYNFSTDEFADLLEKAHDEPDYSNVHEEVLFQMHLILSHCICAVAQKKKGYINGASRCIKAFHNLPRAFLPITDRAKISPQEALEYAKSYLKSN